MKTSIPFLNDEILFEKFSLMTLAGPDATSETLHHLVLNLHAYEFEIQKMFPAEYFTAFNLITTHPNLDAETLVFISEKWPISRSEIYAHPNFPMEVIETLLTQNQEHSFPHTSRFHYITTHPSLSLKAVTAIDKILCSSGITETYMKNSMFLTSNVTPDNILAHYVSLAPYLVVNHPNASRETVETVINCKSFHLKKYLIETKNVSTVSSLRIIEVLNCFPEASFAWEYDFVQAAVDDWLQKQGYDKETLISLPLVFKKSLVAGL